jgi:signal transduction histidine kinase
MVAAWTEADAPTSDARPDGARQPDAVGSLSREILRSVNRGHGRVEFLRDVSGLLMDFGRCDAIEVWLWKDSLHYRWQASRRPRATTRFKLSRREGGLGPDPMSASAGTDLERLCLAVASRSPSSAAQCFTENGSFWTDDTWRPFTLEPGDGSAESPARLCIKGHHRSLAVTKFFVHEGSIGLLHFKSERPGSFSQEQIELFEEIAQELGLGIAAWRAQAAQRERIKELTCLYGIAQVIDQHRGSLQDTLDRIVRLLPPAWQYPHAAAARIVLDDHSSQTPGFRRSIRRQVAEVFVEGRRRGRVEVVYVGNSPDLQGEVFLPEEERLLETVVRQVALIAERQQAERDKGTLQRQLIHADRLATIGQLAAGVAHELNEPLGSVLGFAQLVQKSAELPGEARRDTEKIVTAALYAREVIRKLMVFARQVPARRVRVSLNQVVGDAFYFLEARCTVASVEVVRHLDAEPAEILADPAQLKQVVVNLVVNAIQAMPDGGTLSVRTRTDGPQVVLEVSDTGTGMSAEVLERAFLPFFTTKDVNEGTGLGLAVVHGIITSHGGSIAAHSEPGRGSRFEVRLPTDGAEEAEPVAEPV